MKNLLLFILAILVGFLLMMFYPKPSNSQTQNLISPQSNFSYNQFSPNQPPTESLKGDLTFLSGSISWQSRIATQPAQIKLPQKIQQGEEVATGDDSSVTVEFDSIASVVLASNSTLTLNQTLPANLVFNQTQGMISYTKIGSLPISIRSLHLLTNLNQGQAVISVNLKTDVVTVAVKKGSVSLAFIDSKNITQVVSLTSERQFKFDSDNRQEID